MGVGVGVMVGVGGVTRGAKKRGRQALEPLDTDSSETSTPRSSRLVPYTHTGTLSLPFPPLPSPFCP